MIDMFHMTVKMQKWFIDS